MKMSLQRFEQKLLNELKATVLPTHRKEPGHTQQCVNNAIKKRHCQDLCALMKRSISKVVNECFVYKNETEFKAWWKHNIDPCLSTMSDDACKHHLGKKKFKQWSNHKARRGT